MDRDMEYTKGEWKLTKDKRQIWVGDGTDKMCVAYLGIKGMSLPDDECIANAHLIAAAPDMYEALRQYVRIGILDEYPNYLKGAKNILAEAEGK